MFQISELARTKIQDAIDNYTKEVEGIRILANAKSPFKIDYGLEFVLPGKAHDDEQAVDMDGLKVYLTEQTKELLNDTTLDYEEGVMASGFKFERENPVPEELKGTSAEKVLQVIEQQINPSIASHGGWVSLIDVRGNDVYVELGGGCQGCGMANVTLKQGIEVAIKKAVPEIENVYDSTDHAGGSNPYYKQSK